MTITLDKFIIIVQHAGASEPDTTISIEIIGTKGEKIVYNFEKGATSLTDVILPDRASAKRKLEDYPIFKLAFDELRSSGTVLFSLNKYATGDFIQMTGAALKG